ncbi:hypothetical protein GGTG_13394 [Gaeumannomyces tritici R3-111a-1]|uniref:Uncharacterized protein n=1 Tax=Gaeumannomyces tritici (strain R3-111a-1) TaxID=644352 RepID=J3PIR5_GAET3|nr:hypothetical protein GGTG_13394 [Gaeumannomyces tritici R3-111a-1]EJT68997.1 hypothetical protein GGTG_13394 [Gaeumannomyces tritici R3-111a-1]
MDATNDAVDRIPAAGFGEAGEGDVETAPAREATGGHLLEGSKAREGLKSVRRIWGEDKVQYYQWANRGVGFCNKLLTAAREVRDWDEAVVKLNRLIHRRAQQIGRRKVKESVDPIEPDDLVNLKAWRRKDPYVKKNDREGIALPFRKLVVADLPAGFGFDKFGLMGPRKETESPLNRFHRLDARNRENVAHAGLNIRTSADIFEEGQRQHEAARTERQAQRRTAGTTPEPPSRAGEAQKRHGAEIFGAARGTNEAMRAEREAPRRGAVDTSVLARVGVRTSADVFEETRREYEETMAERDASRRGVDTSVLAGLGIRTSADIFEETRGQYEVARRSAEPRRQRIRTPRVESSGHIAGEAEDAAEGRASAGPRRQVGRKRVGFGNVNQPAPKRARTMTRRNRNEEEQAQDLASVLRVLNEEFAEKVRLSEGKEWCVPVPHERKVKTVEAFYKAFHNTRTLPILTCMFCYRKYSRAELEDVKWEWWMASSIKKRDGSPYKCIRCFPVGERISGCADCMRHLRRGALSPAAQVHTRLGCEHMFPDELKCLTPVEEKLIALNSCYGFITKYSITDGHRQNGRYPRHVKGHITVFPNNVQELVTKVLPHPLLKVMDEIHVSWQGPEKPEPSDLAVPLSVRRRVVEKALMWLKGNSPFVHEIGSSGMFDLDGRPDIADVEKLRYLVDSMGETVAGEETCGAAWRGSAEVRRGRAAEPYIVVSRGQDFADSFNTWFLAKTFPTLFPFGRGGPRQAEECVMGAEGEVSCGVDAEVAAQELVSSRNMSLETWAKLVLQRHGGRFAAHPVLAFLIFNMGVRSRNRRVSMASVRKRDFPDVERAIQTLTAARLENARVELETSGKTTDHGVNRLLRNLSLYGYRQPMSRESRLTMRRKIKSLIIRYGIPAIWFTLNPNDITNPIKLKLAAYRTRESGEAEEFLRSLDQVYKRFRLAISDPLSSAIFFHREISMFFKHHVRIGEDSVFGRVSQYYGVVETNERGALHLHGLIWLQGNMHLSTLMSDVRREDQAAYRDRVIEYINSVFTEDLDAEASAGVRAGRSVTAEISSLLDNKGQFAASFEEEANFCAGATQIHTHSPTAWTFLNVCTLYWHIVRRWPLLRRAAIGESLEEPVEETVLLGEGGQRVSLLQAYPYRGRLLEGLALFDYMSVVRLKRKAQGVAWGEVELDSSWPLSRSWVQALRRPGQHATICFDGYLSMDFAEEDDFYHRRAAVQHLGLFVPWQAFLCETCGEINDIWNKQRALLPKRISWLVDNVQLLRRSAEDVAQDAKQWAALSGELEPAADAAESGSAERADAQSMAYRSDNVGTATRLIDVLRSAISAKEITAGSREISAMVEQMYRFQAAALGSAEDLHTAVLPETGIRTASILGGTFSGAETPGQEQLRSIKAQQAGLSREREKAIQGIQSGPGDGVAVHGGTAQNRFDGPVHQDDPFAVVDCAFQLGGTEPSTRIRFGPSTSFCEVGRQVAESLTLNRRQRIALWLICRQLDQVRRDESGTPQLCLFVGGEGGTGKSRVIAGVAELFRPLRIDGQTKMDWQEKDVLIIDEVSMLGDRSDVEYLNSTCYQEGRRIPWESGITVVTPLNRNRWNLNIEATIAFQRQRQAPLRIFVSEHKWKNSEPTEEEALMIMSHGDDSAIPVTAVFMFVPGMPVVVNQNTHQGFKLVNGASYTAVDVVPDRAHRGHRVNADTFLHFGPPAGILLASETTRDFRFHDVSRRGLPCAAAFACTDYKVQGKTLDRVGLELRGTRTTNIGGQAVPSTCDPYSLYVQLSRCRTLDGITLLSKAREQDFVGNTVPEEMAQAEQRLEQLSEETIRAAELWGWSGED